MQPYFFPYLGYYSLIRQTDRLIIFDTVQFIRHGWIERNRILKPSEGWQYIAVPLQKHSRETKIGEIKIRVIEDWKNKILRQLLHYKKAPNFTCIYELISAAINIPTDSIVELNTYILSTTCSYLDIPFQAAIFSEMNLEIEEVIHPGQWALNICKATGAAQYLNLSGGKELFKQSEFDNEKISLKFINQRLTPYDQHRVDFQAGLSIIDVMMYNSVAEISVMLNQYDFV